MSKSRGVLIVAMVVAAATGAILWLRHRTDRPMPKSAATSRAALPATSTARDPAQAGRANVKVSDTKGPIVGATVRFERDRGDVTIVATGSDGVATAAGLEPGSWHISAAADGHEPAAAPAQEIHAGETVGVELVLRAGGRALTGIVTDVSGGPIAGARIDAAKLGHVARPSDAIASVQTGADGRYKLSVAEGQLLVAASEASYSPQSRYVEIGATGATANFQLVPGGVIEGVVRDERTREPISGASVEAERDTAAMLLGERASQRVTTGGDGRFRITGLRPGAYELSAQATGGLTSRAPTVVGLGVAEQVSDVELLIGRMPTIRGVVIDENGTPAPHVNVHALSRPGEGADATSDAKGAFTLEGLSAGSYRLSGDGDGFVPTGTTPVEVAETDQTGIKVNVRHGLRIKGHVEARQVCDVQMRFDATPSRDDLMLFVAPTTTAADGSFDLGPAPPGTYQLEARCPSGDQGTKTVEVRAAMAEIVIEVKPGGSIAGRVVDGNGRPIAAMTVMATPATAAEHTMIVNGLVTSGIQAVTNAAGAFELRGLVATTYRLRVLDRGRPLPMTTESRVAVAAAEHKTGVTLAVDRPDGVIRGVVTGPDGKPLADAWVSVHQELADMVAGMGGHDEGDSRMVMVEAQDDGGGAGGVAPVLTDGSGKFEIAGLPRVPWTAVAEAQGGKLRGRLTRVVPDAQVTIQALGLGDLRGVVHAGAVPSWFHVELEGPTRAERTFSSRDGTFSFGRLDAGDYTVTVTSPSGNGTARVHVVAGQPASVEITLAGNAVVVGKLVDKNGKPQGGLPLTIVPASGDGRLRVELTGPPQTSNPDGTFRLEAKAGPSALVVMVQPKPVVHKGLALEPGKTIDVGAITVETAH